MTPFNPPPSGTQPIPTFRFDEGAAKDAYAVHTALLDQERRFPALKDNPAWLIVRQDAYEAFALAFGGEA